MNMKSLVVSIVLLMLAREVPGNDKIIGGQVAEPFSFPFQVALILKRGENEKILCGGSLISRKYVLTAGHCLKGTSKTLVILGSHDLLALNETGAERHVETSSSYRVHPLFSYQHANSDIGLIKLSKPVTFSNSIQPVKIPFDLLLDETFAEEIGTISGFGQFCDQCESSHLLRFTTNRIMKQDECSKFFPFTTIPSESQICLATAETRTGSCRGDSGGLPTFLNGG